MDFIVIWALGISMIVLSGLLWLPRNAILAFGLVVVFGHNLLDAVQVSGKGLSAFLWSLVHQPGLFSYRGYSYVVLYPVVPWVGVMGLGYVSGNLYDRGMPAAKRKKMLLSLGGLLIILFIFLRGFNLYGDPRPWSRQASPLFSLFSFLDVNKYPPSLSYLLVTLGPALVFLALTEKAGGWLSRALSVYGRVPLFYYILHIYLLHALAMGATLLCGHRPSDMILQGFAGAEPNLKGYGFSLGVVYFVWVVVVLALYPVCAWYDRYKRDHKNNKWLSYL